MDKKMDFFDSETYQGSTEKVRFKDLVIEQVRRINRLQSVEWKGGYFEKRTQVIQGAVLNSEYYVPDTRSVYINAVHCLGMMLSHYYDDKGVKEARKNYDDNKEKIEEKKMDKDEKKDLILEITFIFHESLSQFLGRRDYFSGEKSFQQK